MLPTGVTAYAGAAALISDKTYLTAAAGQLLRLWVMHAYTGNLAAVQLCHRHVMSFAECPYFRQAICQTLQKPEEADCLFVLSISYAAFCGNGLVTFCGLSGASRSMHSGYEQLAVADYPHGTCRDSGS